MLACGMTRQIVPARSAANPCTRSTDWNRSQTPSASSGSCEMTVTCPVTVGSRISVRWVICETCSQSARMSASRRLITNFPGSAGRFLRRRGRPCHDCGESQDGEEKALEQTRLNHLREKDNTIRCPFRNKSILACPEATTLLKYAVSRVNISDLLPIYLGDDVAGLEAGGQQRRRRRPAAPRSPARSRRGPVPRAPPGDRPASALGLRDERRSDPAPPQPRRRSAGRGRRGARRRGHVGKDSVSGRPSTRSVT